ncbi:MAG TPA: GntR family transcriptional regulator [Azospirillaceae bacterium]|nr:GntR family transcriptional regulator [Azospirillaceae bacterium]
MKSEKPLNLDAPERGARETLNQWVYRCLRHAVMIGRVPPGRALTIREIAEALGVSTMPVREALRRLATEQALEVRDNRRVLVPHMTAAKFRELCELRIALESHAAERALPYINANHMGELIVIDDRLDTANAAGDHEAVTGLNQQFHRCLYEANPHQVSMPLIESVWLQLGPFTRLALSKLQDFYTIDRHSQAIEAIRCQDPRGLRIAIEADIRDGVTHVGTAELLNAYIRSAGQAT